ncbi:MAG: hypothetical protein IJM28_00605, partial [Lachnospiraceae bacterium]|nr:hypothetical protein [Lachnospiraceae bacterium]
HDVLPLEEALELAHALPFLSGGFCRLTEMNLYIVLTGVLSSVKGIIRTSPLLVNPFFADLRHFFGSPFRPMQESCHILPVLV